MSSKIGLMLSLLLFSMFFLLGVDLICIEYHYSSLDAIAINVGYAISNHGGVEESFIKKLENKYNVDIYNISPSYPNYGDEVSFTVGVTYNPVVVSNKPLLMRVSRSTYIGYYE